MKKAEIDRRELEHALQKSQKMFTVLLDSLSAIVYVTDIKTNEILYVNEYSRDIFGDVVGKICWQAMQTDQTGPCDFCTNDKLLTPEGKPTGVYRWEFQNTVNGRWYDIHDRAIEWIDGRIARIEIATDITERKNLEQTLKTSEERYRDLFENAGAPIFIVDNNFSYIDVNKKATELLGYSKEELLKTNILELIPPDQVQRSKDTFRRLHSKGEYHDFIGKVRTKDGRWLDIEVSSTAIKKGDMVVGSRDIVRDITDRKKMMDELQALSYTDDLTGLRNRRGFFVLLDHRLRIADREKKGQFLLYADLDNLKTINDTYGHKEGDLALIDTATILQDTYRKSDIVARMGGDEFVVYPVGAEGHAEIIINRLKQSLDIYNAKSKKEYKLSISIGLAYYDPNNPCSVDELLAHADKSLYKQKRTKDGN